MRLLLILEKSISFQINILIFVMPFRKKNGRFISKKEDDRTRKFVEMISRKLPGRRVVDVDILAKNLSCEVCGLSLSLTNITDEQRHGLGSYFHIRCECKHMNKIPTGTNHQSKLKGPPVFDVNTKAIAAMIHAGLGPSHIAETFSVINISPPTARTLKKRACNWEQRQKKLLQCCSKD